MPCAECELLLDENVAAQLVWRSRVSELEDALAEERQHSAELQRRLQDVQAQRSASDRSGRAGASSAEPPAVVAMPSRPPFVQTPERPQSPTQRHQQRHDALNRSRGDGTPQPPPQQHLSISRTRSPTKPVYVDAAGTPALLASIQGLRPRSSPRRSPLRARVAGAEETNASAAAPFTTSGGGEEEYVDVDEAAGDDRPRGTNTAHAGASPAATNPYHQRPSAMPVRRRVTSPSARSSPMRETGTPRNPPSFAAQWIESQAVLGPQQSHHRPHHQQASRRHAPAQNSAEQSRSGSPTAQSRRRSPPRPKLVMSPSGDLGLSIDDATARRGASGRKHAAHGAGALRSPAMED
jgi:hypothetical protein